MSTTTRPRVCDVAPEFNRGQPVTSSQPLHRGIVSGMPAFESERVANNALKSIRAALRATEYGELNQLEVDMEDGVVTLFGNVPTYYLKQLAQEVARNQLAVRRVINTVIVGR